MDTFISGDLVLVKSNNKMGNFNLMGQKFTTFQDAKFTHILMAIDAGLFIEAMPNKGVTILSILDLIVRLKEEYSAYVVYRHKPISENLDTQKRITERVFYYYGQSYNNRFIISQQEIHDASYCSELISKIYNDVLQVSFKKSAFYDIFPVHIHTFVKNHSNWDDISSILQEDIKRFEPYLEYIKTGTIPKNPTDHDVNMLQAIHSIKDQAPILREVKDLELFVNKLETYVKNVFDIGHMFLNDLSQKKSKVKSNTIPNKKENFSSQIQHMISSINSIAEIDNQLNRLKPTTSPSFASLSYEEKIEGLQKQREFFLSYHKKLYKAMLRLNSDVHATAAFFIFYKINGKVTEIMNLLENMLKWKLCTADEILNKISSISSGVGDELYFSQNFLWLISDMYHEAMLNFYKLKQQEEPSEDFCSKSKIIEIIDYFAERTTDFNLFLRLEDISLLKSILPRE